MRPVNLPPMLRVYDICKQPEFPHFPACSSYHHIARTPRKIRARTLTTAAPSMPCTCACVSFSCSLTSGYGERKGGHEATRPSRNQPTNPTAFPGASSTVGYWRCARRRCRARRGRWRAGLSFSERENAARRRGSSMAYGRDFWLSIGARRASAREP